MPQHETTMPVEAVEVEVIQYCIECPECGEWHLHDSSQINKAPFECICGTAIKATLRIGKRELE